jgi:hypothetical protein
MSKGLSKEDTKQEHPLQAVVLCDAWGEEARWGPLVRRNKTDEEEFEGTEVGGEQRPWVSIRTSIFEQNVFLNSMRLRCNNLFSAFYPSSTLLYLRGLWNACPLEM